MRLTGLVPVTAALATALFGSQPVQVVLRAGGQRRSLTLDLAAQRAELSS